MATFISGILSEIRNQYNGDYRKLCIVFPTRRACLIFRKQLAELHETPVWAPGVMAIGDFVSANVKVKVAEEIPLLVALFDVYKKYWPDQDFGKYYSWGKMLISDFDEIAHRRISATVTRRFVNSNAHESIILAVRRS